MCQESLKGNTKGMSYSILLATYNGERFLPEFLASLPTTETATLLVRDDGSLDNTVKILQEFSSMHGVKLQLHTGKNLGAKQNFAYVWKELESPYFFFADQDDIWEHEKVPTMLKEMQAQEEKHGKDKPILVYSDASLINMQSKITHISFANSYTIPNQWSEDFKNILSMPNVLGCTMLGNRALAKAALPMPEEALMHDGWCLMVAGALGVVKEVPLPLTRYRLHDLNVVGLGFITWKNIIFKIFNGLVPKRKVLRDIQVQAGALLKHCGHKMSAENRELCAAWAKAADASWVTRRIIYLRYGFKRVGLSRRLIMWLCG